MIGLGFGWFLMFGWLVEFFASCVKTMEGTFENLKNVFSNLTPLVLIM